MKQYISILLSCLFLLSCQQEEMLSPVEEGYLALSAVDVQEVQINKVPTRATVASEPLHVDILQNEVVVPGHSYTADNLPAKIKLPVGNYTLEIYSDSYKQPADGLGAAIYHHSQSFDIAENKTTNLGVIKLGMANIGVSLQLPQGFDTWFPTYTFKVTIGETSKELKNGETAYLDFVEGGTLSYTLSATNSDGESSHQEGSYKDALSANTIYTVTYSLETQTVEMVE